MDADGAPVDHPKAQELAWGSPVWALWLICRGATFRTAAPVALVVGTLLTAINQPAVLLSGSAPGADLLRVLANYAIPYTVSSVGYLSPFRTR